MKYDLQLSEVKKFLPNAQNILIALPAGADIDKMAAGLALFLAFEAQGKQASIVCDDAILVGHTHLFGVDHVLKTFPQTEGGNLTLTLEGVAASDNTVPALEKLDWFAENTNLNLVFHVLPGQTFQPAKIVPKYQGSGFNLIFVIGALNLNSLGNIYLQNQNAFLGTHIVNIDTQVTNTSFGQSNIIDTTISTISELMTNLLSDLGIIIDADTASNLLSGIFDGTNNLTDPKVSADTYMVIANCLRSGGKKPQAQAPLAPQQDLSSLIPRQQVQPQVQPIPEYAIPSAAPLNPTDNNQPSPEELPVGEAVTSETVEPEWLTPKIFKGTSIG